MLNVEVKAKRQKAQRLKPKGIQLAFRLRLWAIALRLMAYRWYPLATWGLKLFAFGLYSLSALGFLLWPAYSLPLIAGIRLQLGA
jgi:hypothetical protein